MSVFKKRSYFEIHSILLLEPFLFFFDSTFKLVNALVHECPQACSGTEIQVCLSTPSVSNDVKITSDVPVITLTIVMGSVPTKTEKSIKIIGWSAGIIGTIH
jgi:hypothetical protein